MIPIDEPLRSEIIIKMFSKLLGDPDVYLKLEDVECDFLSLIKEQFECSHDLTPDQATVLELIYNRV